MTRVPASHRADVPPPRGGLADQATTSVAWSVSQKWVIRITGLLTVAILTRLLSPADFGVVAVALTLLPLVQVLSDLGFSAYLVQADRIDRRMLSTAFWFSAGMGVLLSGGMVLAAVPVSRVLQLPEVEPVIQAFGVATLSVTLGSVPVALMRRELRFRALAVQAVVAGAIGQAIAIALALAGFGVWALVAQTVVFQLITTILAFWATRWHPAFAFSRADLSRMALFGGKVVSVELVTIGRLWAENAIVVSLLGPTGLGYLNIAQRLVQTAQDLSTSALVPVSVVVFARVRDAADRLRAGYLRAQGISYAIVAPIMVLLAVGTPWLLPLMFGPQWTPSILPGQILAVAGIFMLGALDHGLFYGLGRPGRWFVYATVIEAIALTTTALTAPHGLVAIALGALAVAITATIARWFLVGPLLAAPWWRIAQPLGRVLLPALAAGGGGMLAGHLAGELPPVVVVLLIGATVLPIYVLLVRFSSRSVWDDVRGLAGTAVARARRRS
ncbi:lipopolysaccharide biosynthesis protein [Microbacterium caowuchunii]|uniref:Lipopolysaccharide biosynthesis protein n=1 Tax=Microbacterium caowuchunii TaxID=2614638 RepID=A0A5N0TK30_9MICO|nr:lipopolysaccharide biosynthesis protein [Microbacterium caowuchunii]KAA9135535.1 lipopolysaccharide biosynthesis protein [Microbacterium caowuchunii]